MKTISIRLDLRFVCLLLVLIIAGMLAVWQPWEERTGKKSLSVTGQAAVERMPDQYVFTPRFSSDAASPGDAVAEVSRKGTEVLAGLKQLGIAEDRVATRIDSVNAIEEGVESQLYPARSSEPYIATYYIICKVKDRAMAQKVTDFLAVNGAVGGITPEAEFTQETRAGLDAEVRQKALQDARAKAETEARELGIKLGPVITVNEDPSLNSRGSERSRASAGMAGSGTAPVLSGLQPVSLVLSVTYAIK